MKGCHARAPDDTTAATLAPRPQDDRALTAPEAQPTFAGIPKHSGFALRVRRIKPNCPLNASRSADRSSHLVPTNRLERAYDHRRRRRAVVHGRRALDPGYEQSGRMQQSRSPAPARHRGNPCAGGTAVLCHERLGAEPRARLAELLLERSGFAGGRVYFTLGGADANEHAIKFARQASGKSNGWIITRQRSYHGASYAAMALSGDRAPPPSRIRPPTGSSMYRRPTLTAARSRAPAQQPAAWQRRSTSPRRSTRGARRT